MSKNNVDERFTRKQIKNAYDILSALIDESNIIGDHKITDELINVCLMLDSVEPKLNIFEEIYFWFYRKINEFEIAQYMKKGKK